jgi:hypothetical protein
VRALRRKPLIILRLGSWLPLDFVHTEHLWHCRSSPLLTNHLSHLLMVATRSRQEIPRTVTANPRTRLCLRSGVIPRRTVCTWADLTAVIGFHPNLKPLQRHKGVGLRDDASHHRKSASKAPDRRRGRASLISAVTWRILIRQAEGILMERHCIAPARLQLPLRLSTDQHARTNP